MARSTLSSADSATTMVYSLRHSRNDGLRLGFAHRFSSHVYRIASADDSLRPGIVLTLRLGKGAIGGMIKGEIQLNLALLLIALMGSADLSPDRAGL